ncbi:MAG: tetratricopeptide repeat protein [Acidobacteriota bacterium]
MRLAEFPGAIAVLCLAAALAAECAAQQTPGLAAQKQSALALEQEGKIAEAEAAWRSFSSGHPNDWEAYAHLGLLEARQQHYGEAIALDRKALSLNPKMPNLRVNLGLSQFKGGDLRGAIQTFAPLLRSTPPSSPMALRLTTLTGLAHYGLGEYAASVPYLKTAAAADPGNLELRMTLAHSCLWSKQYQCVLDTYHQILALNAESAEADMLAGEAYDELNNSAGALEEFQAAVKADPKQPNVHFGYGYLLWKALKFRDAEAEFKAELAQNPENPLALAYLGDSEMRLNQTDAAMPHLEQAVRIQPAIPIAHLDLGILYEGRGRKQDALRELKAAERLEPGDPLVHWNLGRYYRSTGQMEEARGEFEKTRTLQNRKNDSLREKMNQIEAAPAGESTRAPAK